jgi:hypothetical protein
LEGAPEVQAITAGQQVYLNPDGWAFNSYTRGGQPYNALQFYFDKLGVTQQQFAFAVIIHEFLHTTGRFKSDVSYSFDGNKWTINGDQSREYQEEVIKNCFSTKAK